MAANALLAAAKFAVFLVTGSASIFAEALHSTADLANQSLLAVGLRRSAAPPDLDYPYGYGRERYVWALLAASGVLFLGAGATLWNGLERLLDPGELDRLPVALGMLGLALVGEGSSFVVALVGLLRSDHDRGLLQSLGQGADPVLIGVLFEDGAAVLGVLLAASGVGLAHWTGDARFDAAGGVAVGLLMGVSAAFLIDRNRRLLVGRSAEAEREAVLHALRQSPVVRRVRDVKATVIGPESVRFKAEIDFDGAELARLYLAELDAAELRRRTATDEDLRAFLTEYTDRVVERLGDEVDRIEEDIQRREPRVLHIDLEVD